MGIHKNCMGIHENVGINLISLYSCFLSNLSYISYSMSFTYSYVTAHIFLPILVFSLIIHASMNARTYKIMQPFIHVNTYIIHHSNHHSSIFLYIYIYIMYMSHIYIMYHYTYHVYHASCIQSDHILHRHASCI